MYTIKTNYEHFVNKIKKEAAPYAPPSPQVRPPYALYSALGCLPVRRFFWNFAIKFSKLALTVSETREKLKQFLIYKRVFKEIPQLFWKDLKTQLL